MTEKYKYPKMIIFAALVLSILVLLSTVIDPSKAKVRMDNVERVSLEFQKEKENSIDVIVLGDSEPYNSISPLQMYKDYGFTSYIAATPAQRSYQTYEMLESVLKTQKPEVCIIEPNFLFRKYSLIAVTAPKLEKLFPIFKYHNAWKGMVDSDYKCDNSLLNNFKGFHYHNTVNPALSTDYMKKTERVEEISEANIVYIEKMIELCKQNDIQLIFVRTPSTINWNYAKHNAIEQIAEANNIKFIDMNLEDSIKIDWKKDTHDKGDHVNYSGAYKVTSYLGSYLNEKFELPDHRDDSAYSSWNEMIPVYLNKVS